MTAPPRILVLPDGRRLAWHEYGAPDGDPCIYIPGTPSSGLMGALYDEAAREAGVRWISVDKPGYGLSDFQPGRRLPGFAADVGHLADELGLSRFAVVGESGGGPHALAVAHGLGERLTIALVLAGMGPGHEPWARQGMNPLNQAGTVVARWAPWALRAPMALMAWTLSSDRRAERLLESQRKSAPEADRQLMDELDLSVMLAASRDAFRAGARGAAQEWVMFVAPWGFDVAHIACAVELWHGTEDSNVPVEVSRRMAAAIPDATLHVVGGAGHAVGYVHRADVMAAVRRAAGQAGNSRSDLSL